MPNALWNGGLSDYPPQVQWHYGFVWQSYTRYRAHTRYTAPLFVGNPVSTARKRLIVIPYWFPVAIFAYLPAAPSPDCSTPAAADSAAFAASASNAATISASPPTAAPSAEPPFPLGPLRATDEYASENRPRRFAG